MFYSDVVNQICYVPSKSVWSLAGNSEPPSEVSVRNDRHIEAYSVDTYALVHHWRNVSNPQPVHNLYI